jgi:hypothetical protein
MRALAAVLALITVALMSLAIIGIVTGRPSDRAGWLIRMLALICFVAAVALNLAAR